MKSSSENEIPIVSIIMPTYNRAKLISRAIKSVLKQSYRKFELIIIDDGSTDNSNEKVSNFTDPRIRYIKFKDNRGKAPALNDGIRASTGKYITFLDDDDELHYKMLEKEVDLLKNTSEEIGFVTGLGIAVENKRISLYNKKIFKNREDLLKKQSYFCAISLSGALIKKKCFDEVGFLDENLVTSHDWEFMFRLIKHFDFIHINKIVYKAHYDDSSNISHISSVTGRNPYRMIKIFMIFLKNHIEDIRNYRKILAKHYFRIARISYHIKKFQFSKKFFKAAFQTNPINFRHFCYYLIAPFGNKLFFLSLLDLRIFRLMGKIRGHY